MKKGYMPQKIELYYLIPAIRKKFAEIMIGKGLSQREVAKTLGITESAVSQYMREKRARQVVSFDSAMKREMERSVARVMGGGSLIKEIQRICGLCRNRRFLCRISKKLGYAPKECRECFG